MIGLVSSARLRQGARLFPQAGVVGPIPWVIAILITLVVIAAAGGLALKNLANSARSDLSSSVTVQIIEADPGAGAPRAPGGGPPGATPPQVNKAGGV
ncbi:MAG: hypothetical protein AAGB23_08515, partial [Pseudomonadota bacterium]